MSAISGVCDRDGRELRVAVDQVLVDLVGDHPQVVGRGPPADLGDLLRRVHRAGRVGRRHEQQQLGPAGAGRLQVLDAGQVAGALIGQDRPDDAAREGDGLGVGGPVRGRHQHLVARVEQGGERLVHGLLAAVGDQDLAGLDLVAGISRGLGRDRRPELGQAGRGGVLVEPRLGARALRGLDDVAGGREVRFAGPEADDRPARRLERLGLGVHGQRGGFGDSGDACGDSRRHGLHSPTGRQSAKHAAAIDLPSRVPGTVRRRGGSDVHCMHRQRCCRCGSMPVCLRRAVAQQRS